VAGVDEVVGSADEAVEVVLEGAGGVVGADGGEVGGSLAVEEAEVAEIGTGEGTNSVGFGLTNERFEALPVILAVGYPEVRNHLVFFRFVTMSSLGQFERQGFADQLSIETPEGVDLRYSVAGIGSRCLAQLIDQAIICVFYIVMVIVFSVVLAAGLSQKLDTMSNWFVAIFLFINFLLIWGYFVLFEAYWHGQTPGKRALGLRVIKDGGRQITLFEAMARNLLRVVDYLPGLYLTGVITMLCNKRNKRLGDLAAGTIVVHERVEDQGLLTMATSGWRPQANPVTGPGAAMFAADAVGRLTGKDLVVIEAFFARALDLSLGTRLTMAEQILGQMTAKMGVEAPAGVHPERALEAIAMGMRGSGRRW
jgi:uncharacterized RDD family membrane protein YckC